MSQMTPEKAQNIIEAALMISGQPLTINALGKLFSDEERPESTEIKSILESIKARHEDTGIELQQVASGYRIQARSEMSEWLARMLSEKPPRYSRAFMETLAIIAYKQPITRAEIEEIRGVTVSSNIIKTLQEREWVRIVGNLEVPGRPAIYGTTKIFLDYFNLKSLSELPTLAEFKAIEAQDEQLQVQLALENSNIGPNDSEVIPEERDAVVAEDQLAASEATEEAIDETVEAQPTTDDQLAASETNEAEQLEDAAEAQLAASEITEETNQTTEASEEIDDMDLDAALVPA